MAVNELYHYSVYDPDKKMCYFGLVRIESFLAMMENNDAPAEDPPAEETPAEDPPAEAAPMEFTPLEVDDTTSRQVQINIEELKVANILSTLTSNR